MKPLSLFAAGLVLSLALAPSSSEAKRKSVRLGEDGQELEPQAEFGSPRACRQFNRLFFPRPYYVAGEGQTCQEAVPSSPTEMKTDDIRDQCTEPGQKIVVCALSKKSVFRAIRKEEKEAAAAAAAGEDEAAAAAAAGEDEAAAAAAGDDAAAAAGDDKADDANVIASDSRTARQADDDAAEEEEANQEIDLSKVMMDDLRINQECYTCPDLEAPAKNQRRRNRNRPGRK